KLASHTIDLDVAHQAEVDLRFFAWPAVGDPHRRPLLVEAELRVREPPQRRVPDDDALALEQLEDTHEPQRALLRLPGPRRRRKPRRDSLTMRLQRCPLCRRLGHRPLLHGEQHAPNNVVTQLILQSDTRGLRGLDVAAHGLAITNTGARNRSRTRPRLPTTEHLDHVQHVQLPIAHGASRRRSAPSTRGTLSVPRKSLARSATHWPHGPGECWPHHPGDRWPHDPGEFRASTVRVAP